MRQRFEFRMIVGVLIWVALMAVTIIFLRKSHRSAPDVVGQLATYIGSQRRTVEIEFLDHELLRVGDPVFSSDPTRVAPIGVVCRIHELDSDVETLSWVHKAHVLLFGDAPPLSDQDYFAYHIAPDSVDWVMKTMLPPSKRDEIGKLILDSYRANQDSLVKAFQPVIERSLKDASSVIREDLQNAFAARESEIKAIGDRFQSEVIEKELIPLVQEEIWPIVREECEPLVGQIGKEIWSEVSVFRFGWRFLYDKTPLPDRKLTEKEFKRFVDNKAVPIIESHIGDIVELQKQLIIKISANEQVKDTMSKTVKSVVADPEVQSLLTDVFRDVLLDNDRLQEVIEQRWNGPQAREAIYLAKKRLEPTITEIGVAMFGSPSDKITPEFARVLRHRILHKDSRWLVLHQVSPTEMKAPTTKLEPKKLPVKVSTTEAQIPYAPARRRN